jgi:peptide deformylase
MKLPIVTGDVPILRRKAEKIRSVDDRIRNLAADMHETLAEAAGVGLAAPQIGVSERLVVVRVPANYLEEGQDEIVQTLVNPEIVTASGEQYGSEGCLSLPGIVASLPRSERVTVRWLDLDGHRHRETAHGEYAKIFQHEIDHLDGILFLDRVIDKSSIRRPKA